MNYTFEKNIESIYQDKGRNWLADLPVLIEGLKLSWNLSDIIPVENMTYNYVAKAKQDNTRCVVLKISCDAKLLTDEIKMLQHFENNGAIKVIAYNPERSAALLQQAIPGTSLKLLYPQNVDKVMEIYVDVVRKLHRQVATENKHPYTSQYTYRNVKEWLAALDNITSPLLPAELMSKAIQLKRELLNTTSEEKILHGDLHHDNIIQDRHAWRVIDPKGIVGELGFEIAAFDFIHQSELENNLDIPSLFKNRIEKFSHKSGLEATRLAQWVYVRLMMSAAWFVEDQGDPEQAIVLARQLLASKIL